MKAKVLEYLNGQPYYPCMLLVAREVALLEEATMALARDASWPLISVGAALSSELLTASPARWSRAARHGLRQLLSDVGPGPTVLLHVDLLFEPALRLDPLAIFRDTSRSVPLVVAWPGDYDGSTLSYAVPEHAHYRTWRDPQVGVLRLQP